MIMHVAAHRSRAGRERCTWGGAEATTTLRRGTILPRGCWLGGQPLSEYKILCPRNDEGPQQDHYCTCVSIPFYWCAARAHLLSYPSAIAIIWRERWPILILIVGTWCCLCGQVANPSLPCKKDCRCSRMLLRHSPMRRYAGHTGCHARLPEAVEMDEKCKIPCAW